MRKRKTTDKKLVTFEAHEWAGNHVHSLPKGVREGKLLKSACKTRERPHLRYDAISDDEPILRQSARTFLVEMGLPSILNYLPTAPCC